MPNTAIITESQLREVDKTVYSPASANLVGRKLFSSYQVADGAEDYTYEVIKSAGKASWYSNGATDLPVSDSSVVEKTQKLYYLGSQVRYTYLDIKRANKAGVNLPTLKAQITAQAIADMEDRIIFWGDKEKKLNGLANMPGSQTLAADGMFSTNATTKQLDKPSDVVDGLKTAKEMFTHLPNYHNKTCSLALPTTLYDLLQHDINEYKDQTALQKVQAMFDQVVPVDELDKEQNKDIKQNTGLIFSTEKTVNQLLDGMPLTRLQTEYRSTTTYIPYLESFGGLIARYPKSIIRLTNM